MAIVYLDNQATAPIDPRVLEKMVPYLTDRYANCHSLHRSGREALVAVEAARGQVAQLIGARPQEIIFTSGATESNNIAVKGAARYYQKPHVITSQIEHKCVMESVRALEAEGFETHFLGVDSEGFVKMDELRECCERFKGGISLVSIMAANNEVGTVQDIKQIGAIAHAAGAVFHTDAAQAAGKIGLSVENVDLMSLSGHKMYGPKGVGALYLRRRTRVEPLFSGGGQEQNVRSGTVPVFLVVGMGEAAQLARTDLENDRKHYENLWNYCKDRFSKLEATKINGPEDLERRIANCFNISFLGVEGESLMLAIDDEVAVSTGSACQSQSLEPSHVLHAMGVPAEASHTAVRIGFNRWMTTHDVELAASKLEKEVNRLRDMSVVWDMMREQKSTIKTETGVSAEDEAKGVRWVK